MKNLTDMQFGKLVALRFAGRNKNKRVLWLCNCVCGRTAIVSAHSLLGGVTKSCGCARYEKLIQRNLRHGDSKRNNVSSEYQVWADMIKRCTNPKRKDYPQYGGRGIAVCDKWIHSYEAFIADVGRRPSSELTLDRINNDGNYEPTNVRWATKKQQAANRRPRNYDHDPDDTKNR